MDSAIVKLMLRNLVDRLEQCPDSGKWVLRGPVSSMEFEALKLALDFIEGQEVSASNDAREGDEQKETAPTGSVGSHDVQLNLASTELSAPDEDAILCLDFGTAMSKAVATRGPDGKLFALPLGERAGEPNLKFPVSSTLFITAKGNIYFGPEAIRESLSERDLMRSRFDSPKQHISQGSLEQTLDKVVGRDINPTQVKFTNGDLITVYLSYLTDLACSSLELEGVSRYVRRRFARPRWQNDRAQWADELMRRMLAKAQILADTFSGKWDDGLDVSSIRRALDQLGELDYLPEYLIDVGVFEAVAAASGSLPWGAGQRRLYMVVDVGAGTTDYGLFVVVSPKGAIRRPRINGVANSDVVLRQAGDQVDEILLLHILEQEGILSGGGQHPHISHYLRRNIRDLKETMFRDGVATYKLPNDTAGSVKKGRIFAESSFCEIRRNL